jgi:G6PDH family F420-dependent oxidoreductase
MAKYGFTLLCETHGPHELIEQAKRAEAAGFDFLVISDHFHPWLPEHGHSPFAWSVLGAVATQTSRIELATMVTCPFMRYHPAVIAQASATVGVLSNGRFTLGLGAGERLNEHVVGGGWPDVEERHGMLVEAAEAIRELWSGDLVSYDGLHVTVRRAQLYDLPPRRPGMYIAVSGPDSVQSALEIGEGMCTVEPMPNLVQQWLSGGGDPAQTWGQMALSWDDDRDRAVKLAYDRFRFGMPGWSVMAELPEVRSFAAATKLYRPEDVAEQVPSGADAATIVEKVSSWIDAGYENLAVVQIADDLEGFLRAWERAIRPQLP